MVLTRTMKELWLFGGLDTIPAEDSVKVRNQAETRRRVEEDESFVVEGLMEYLNTLSATKESKSDPTTQTNGTER
jgi:hypothetical protein